MVAIQTVLPYSFAGLVVGVVYFTLAQPAGTLQARFAAAFIKGFTVMAAVLVVLLAADLARRRAVPVALAVPVAFAFFGLLLPWRASGSGADFAHALGSSGLFLAMGAALLTVSALRFARLRLGSRAGALVAGGAVVGLGVALLCAGIAPTIYLNALIAPLGGLGDSLTALLIIVLLQQCLWLVGIHGPALLAPVILPVYLNLQAENSAAMASGAPLPHIVVTSFFLFVYPGGSGATLPLVLLLLRSRVERLRTIAYASLVPALFNTNEPLTLGLPIVFNPWLGLPFVAAPLVLATLSYAAVALGLVDRPAIYVFSTIPQPVGAVLATKDWRAAVLMLVNVAVALAIYAPFVRRYEQSERRRCEDVPA